MAPQCLQGKTQTPSYGFHLRHVITRPSFPLQPSASPSQCCSYNLELVLPPAASLQEIACSVASPFSSNSSSVPSPGKLSCTWPTRPCLPLCLRAPSACTHFCVITVVPVSHCPLPPDYRRRKASLPQTLSNECRARHILGLS